jgi:hypothetical protein
LLYEYVEGCRAIDGLEPPGRSGFTVAVASLPRMRVART